MALRLDDKAIIAWLKRNRVDTIHGRLRFDGPGNYGDDLMKIGISVQPEARLASIQIGHPHKLALVKTFERTRFRLAVKCVWQRVME